MFGDRFFGPAFYGNRYFGPAGDVVVPETGNQDISFVIGLGAMGKARVHPHPLFSRVKQ